MYLLRCESDKMNYQVKLKLNPHLILLSSQVVQDALVAEAADREDIGI